jgi:hypothetical protein
VLKLIVEGEDAAAVLVGAGDHGCVGEAELEVGVAADGVHGPGDGGNVGGLEDEGALFEICGEGVEDIRPRGCSIM